MLNEKCLKFFYVVTVIKLNLDMKYLIKSESYNEKDFI